MTEPTKDQENYLGRIFNRKVLNTLHGSLKTPDAVMWYSDRGEDSKVLSIGKKNPDIEDVLVHPVYLRSDGLNVFPELVNPERERITLGLKNALGQVAQYLHSVGKLDDINNAMDTIDSYVLREPVNQSLPQLVTTHSIPATLFDIPVDGSIDDCISTNGDNPTIPPSIDNYDTGYGVSVFVN
jgi:hypothetical protein